MFYFGPMEFNLADLFEVVVDAVPDRAAVVAGDTRLTYADPRRAGQPAREPPGDGRGRAR